MCSSCFQIGLSAGIFEFINHRATQECLNDLWYGEINFQWDNEFMINFLKVTKVREILNL